MKRFIESEKVKNA
jgi:chromosome segregation ATPase